jgi:LysM domain
MGLEIQIAGSDGPEMVAPIPRFKNSAQAPRVPPEPLRLVLEELQRIAESAVASAVDSDLDAAIGQAAKTIETLGQARQKQENRSERVAMAPPRASTATALESAGSRSTTFDFRSAMKRKSTRREIVLRLGHALHPWRWHVVALAGVLLLAGIFAITLNHAPQNQAAASSRASAYDADPEDAGDAQVITVLVRPNQTLEQLSVLYVGHFDADVYKEIRALNAGLNDPDHIEAGQFLRLPLPQGTLKKVTDTAETSAASQKPAGLFSRIASLWRGAH